MVSEREVAVIGAGIVGVSCALWLQRKGFRVTLIDRQEPGNGASYGNACTFATYATVPINSPSIFPRLPGLIFAKDSPLKIDWSYILQMTPWLLKFLSSCREARVSEIAQQLGKLMGEAEAAAAPLFADSGVRDLLSRRGCLYLYDTKASFDAAQKEIGLRLETGVKLEVLDAEEVRQMEPAISAEYYKGLYFPDAFQYLDPRAVVQKMVDHFVGIGGNFLKAEIQGLGRVGENHVELRSKCADFSFEQVVLSAGAWSKSFFGRGLEKLPLEAERGYHVLFKGQESLISRPVGWASGGFYMTPMNDGLRVAGTVELGSLRPKENQVNIDYLSRKAKGVMDGLEGEGDESWLGFRPTLPDALPVIGRSGNVPEVIFALGHQHVGMTLGGITGRLVSEIAGGQSTSLDVSPFSPSRF